MSDLGDNLRGLREKRGWSQKYVAQKLNIKQSSTYANWEYGIRDPDTETLARLADLFEVTTDYLVGREFNYPKPSTGQTEFLIKEMIDKYGIDLKEPGKKEKLEQLIKLVFEDLHK